MPIIVAIDGPAGSGKSTVAKEVAKRLGFSYVDTGAIYRSLALLVLDEHVSETDELKISLLAKSLPLEIISSLAPQRYVLKGKDVSEQIRGEKVSRLASIVSSYKTVRQELLGIQRRLANTQEKGAVLEGRDIGTVVCPKAQFKFFLTASTQERAHRRYQELVARGENADQSEVAQQIVERDTRDSQRDVAPLRPASDAKVIDTTALSLENVIQEIIGEIHESN